MLINSVLVGLEIGLETIQKYVLVYVSLFLNIFVTARSDRYLVICGLKSYDNMNETLSDSASSGREIPIPYESKTKVHKSFCVILKFADTRLKLLESNYS